MNNQYVLGIDQGASKTLSIVADLTGRIIALGNSMGSNHAARGIAHALDMIAEAAEIALVKANVSMQNIVLVVAGITGLDWDWEEQFLHTSIAEKIFIDKAKLVVVNDSIIALHAGSNASRAAILCAGSGLNCALRNDGEYFSFGYYIKDSLQGGGALANNTIDAVIDAEAGIGPATCLSGLILSHLELKTIDELLYLFVNREIPHKKYLDIVLVLEKGAMLNDEVAVNILYKFGQNISQYVLAGAKKMKMQEESYELVLSGSVFKCKHPALKQGVIDTINDSGSLIQIKDALFEPIIGSVLIALEQISPLNKTAIISQITHDAEVFNLIRGIRI